MQLTVAIPVFGSYYSVIATLFLSSLMHVVKGVSISVSKRRMFRFCITLKQSSI
jgi:hypothetical protein